MELKGKKIIVAISGSIAAYKSAILVRSLIKSGATVKVIMTRAATDFISPLTLATLSKHEVVTDLVNQDETSWNNHVEMGLWADLMLVAPASANTLGKMANGICDNMLLATYLSAKCPVFFAPAMDLDMYKHPSTIVNIQKLISYGNHFIRAGYGELASGLIGDGRMAEPDEIIAQVEKFLSGKKELEGKTVLITAGPTYEAIDPVRFIGNHSSGKMGYAIAEEAASRGAKVILVSGPTALSIQHPDIKKIDVVSADEMFKASISNFDKCHVAILSAAVADFTPVKKADKKIKKQEGLDNIELKETKDILAELGKRKKNQLLVGFALETDNETENAGKKLKNKNLDMIVLNSLQDKGAGFKHDTNKISILDTHNKIYRFELKSKQEVAKDIIDMVATSIAGSKKKRKK